MIQKYHDFIAGGGLRLVTATVYFILGTVFFTGTYLNLKKNEEVKNQIVRYLQKGCDGN